MKRTAIVIASAAVIASGAGVALAAGGQGAAQATKHGPTILRLHVVGASDFDLASGYIAVNQDYNRAGKHVGSDVTTCRPADASGSKARCDVGLALKGGLLTLTFVRSGDSPVFVGKIIDGTGRFRNARGTLKGTGNSDGTADVVLTIRRTR